MTRRASGQRRARCALSALLAALALAAGCESPPEAPAPANPFDPGGPGAGADPFRLDAAPTGTSVELKWSPVAVVGRAGYRVYRRTESETAFALLDSLGPGETSYRDGSPAPDSMNHYRVSVRNAAGEESPPEASGEDSTDVSPLLAIVGTTADAETTSSPDARILFWSPRATAVFLANGVDSSAEIGLDDPVEFAPDPAGYPWRLAPGGGAEAIKIVYGRLRRPGGRLTPITFDTIRMAPIRLEVRVDGVDADTVVTGRRAATLEIRAGSAVDSLEVALDAPFAGAWEPFASPRAAPLPAPGRHTLRIRVKNAFDAVESLKVVIVADTLGAARILLNAGAAQTREDAVTVQVEGGAATAICLTNDSTVAAAGLPACAGGLEPFDGVREGWPLDPAARGGPARVFAFLANEWDTTAALADTIWFLE